MFFHYLSPWLCSLSVATVKSSRVISILLYCCTFLSHFPSCSKQISEHDELFKKIYLDMECLLANNVCVANKFKEQFVAFILSLSPNETIVAG